GCAATARPQTQHTRRPRPTVPCATTPRGLPTLMPPVLRLDRQRPPAPKQRPCSAVVLTVRCALAAVPATPCHAPALRPFARAQVCIAAAAPLKLPWAPLPGAQNHSPPVPLLPALGRRLPDAGSAYAY